MFQNYISKHNSPLTSSSVAATKTPAAAAPIISTPELSRSTIFANLTLTAVNTHSGVAHVVRIDETNPTDNQVLSVAASLSGVPSDAIVVAVRFEVADGVVPTALPAEYDAYPVDFLGSGGALSALSCKDAVSIPTHPVTAGNDVYAGILIWSKSWAAGVVSGLLSVNQVNRETTVLQPLK
jgi:hypothetical protein